MTFFHDRRHNDTLERIAAKREEEEYVMSEYLQAIELHEGKLQEDDLGKDEGWQTASRILYKFNTGSEFEGDEKELTRYGIREISNFNYKFFSPDTTWSEDDSKGIVAYMNDIGTRMTDREKLAFYTLMEAYDEKENTWRGVGRAVKGFATDPTSWAGLVTMAGIGARMTGRLAVKEGIKSMLRDFSKGLATKYSIPIGGAEGSLYAGAYSVMRQQADADLVNHDTELKDFFNMNTAASFGLGGLFGAGATWGIPATGRLARNIGGIIEDIVKTGVQDATVPPVARRFEAQIKTAAQRKKDKETVQSLVDGIDEDLWQQSLVRREENGYGPALTREKAVANYLDGLDQVMAKGTTESVMRTPERRVLQARIANELLEMNGFADLKSYKKVADDGGVHQLEIANDRKIDIVMGPPASGKSTVSEPLVVENQAVLIDADEAKKLLPEFDGGNGANAVHEESAEIAERIMLNEALKEGKNIVLPMLGKNMAKVDKLLDGFESAGYTINLHYVDLPLEKAAQRMLTRHVTNNRLIPISYMMGIGDQPLNTYNAVKLRSGVNGYRKLNNDVAFGQAAQIVEDTITSIGTGPVVRAARGVEDGQHAGSDRIGIEGQTDEIALAVGMQ